MSIMQKILIVLFFLPFFGWGQISVGNNQTICEGDIVNVQASTSVQSSTDSYQVTNIPFAPENTIGSSVITLMDDDVQGPFSIGFTFQFYGNDYTDFYVGSNGWIGFSAGQPTSYFASPIPDSTSITIPRDCIMLTWEDLNPSVGGQVLYQTIGTYPNRKMTLTFDNIPYYGNPIGVGPIISQIVLYEGSNVIDNHVTDKPLHTNPSIQGIHNLSGAVATVVPGRNAAVWSTSNESVRYFPSGVSWYDLSTGQIIGVGDTLEYTPLQSTYLVGVITDSTAQTYADTMYVEVLDADLSTTGVSLCNGPVILSAPSSFSSFLWSTGNSSSNLLTVNTAGDYSVVSTTTNGISCPSDTITVYSGNIPISLSTPDSVFICAGDTVFIDGPLGFVQYNWNTGATASSISTMSPGNYSLSVVDGNGCPGTSNVTSVSMSPTSITATTTGLSLCNGPVTLDAGSGMVASYQWYNNGIVMFGATNQTLLVANAGNFYVEVTYPTGCTATSNILSILAGSSQFTFPIDSVGSGSLCLPNGEVILDAGSYAQYVWSPGGQTTQQISVTVEGSYSVSVIDANGCQGISAAPFVVSNIVTTSPISGPTAPTQFQTVTYSVLPTAGSTYSWMLSGGSIVSGQGTNSIDVIWNSSGMFSFSVIETDMNGCVGEEVSTIVNVIVSSLYDLHESERNLLRVTDILGREIKEGDQPFFYIYDDGTVEKRIVIE